MINYPFNFNLTSAKKNRNQRLNFQRVVSFNSNLIIHELEILENSTATDFFPRNKSLDEYSKYHVAEIVINIPITSYITYLQSKNIRSDQSDICIEIYGLYGNEIKIKSKSMKLSGSFINIWLELIYQMKQNDRIHVNVIFKSVYAFNEWQIDWLYDLKKMINSKDDDNGTDSDLHISDLEIHKNKLYIIDNPDDDKCESSDYFFISDFFLDIADIESLDASVKLKDFFTQTVFDFFIN